MKKIAVSDFTIITGAGSHGSCPAHGWQKLEETGCYSDPTPPIVDKPAIGWGGSCHVYRCPVCSIALAIDDHLGWWGPDELRTERPDGLYTRDDEIKLLKIVAAQYEADVVDKQVVTI